MLDSEGRMKIRVSISSLRVRAFFTSRITRIIRKVLITDVADPTSMVTYCEKIGMVRMIPMSVPTTTMKSNTFQESPNYSQHNAICFMIYSKLNIIAKTRLRKSKILSCSGSGGKLLRAMTNVLARMQNVMKESKT